MLLIVVILAILMPVQMRALLAFFPTIFREAGQS